MSNREDVRAKLFAGKKPRSELVTVFDTELEIRQPTVGVVLDAREESDQRKALVSILLNYCFVPGTDEKVFEKTDQDAIMQWPVGPWLSEINEAISRLTDINVLSAEKNSENAQSDN